MGPLTDLRLVRVAALGMAALLILVPLGQEEMLAQQPGQGWPQNNPYYPQNQQPSYPQQQPYRQPAYPQQPYAQQPYQQPYPDPQELASPQPDYDQSPGEQAQQQWQPLSAEQLEQMVAPIALYPDALVAQILAAATYPAQVAAADHWLQGSQAQGYAGAGQIAAGADAQSWDPSVKALTAFPQMLAQMDHNLQWTTDLGNAYYNQPEDVLQTVQVMRQRAEAAGNLQSTPQETVSNNQGYIEVAPANPQVVYVPAYNPWDVYGQPVSPYPGFSLLGALGSFFGSSPVRFGLGIAMGAFTHTSWGWLGWGLNWLTQSVLFQHSNYYSHSATVAHWNYQRGPVRGYPERGFVARGPNNYRPPVEGYGRPGGAYNRMPAQGFARPPERYAENRPGTGSVRDYRAPGRGEYARPPQEAYNRFQAPARPQSYANQPQQYGRQGYGSGYYGRSAEGYASRPSPAYEPAYRAPAEGWQRGGFEQRSSRAFAESPGKETRSGGFHLFGGGHSSESSRGGGHAPKEFSSKHPCGGGHSGGHHGSGHHR
jgi:hypothetical protein